MKLDEIKVGDRIEGLETPSKPIEQQVICGSGRRTEPSQESDKEK